MNLPNHYLIFVQTHWRILIVPMQIKMKKVYKVSISMPVSTYMRKNTVLYMAKKRRTKGKQNTKETWNYCPRCDRVVYKLWLEKIAQEVT